MTHTPLNGDKLLNQARGALRQPSAASTIRDLLAPETNADDAPDGSNGTSKSEPVAPAKVTATDPSQGHAPARKATNRDPLLHALTSTLGRSANVRRRF